MTKSLPSVCIIGAGPSGLTAMRELKDRGIYFDAYETRSEVGGLWQYSNIDDPHGLYHSLHTNISKKSMEFSCFPMPKSYPDYCHHTLIAKYLREFATYYDLERHIFFNTKVEKAERLNDGLWRITSSHGCKLYDALIVANGYHSSPISPSYSGTFSGDIIHSSEYNDPYSYRGKRVIIVGFGNSAADIACELSNGAHADQVTISTRQGAHILPKYLGHLPIDHFKRHPSEDPWFLETVLPRHWLNRILYQILRFRTRQVIGKPEYFGLPKPPLPLEHSAPVVSTEICQRLGSGSIQFKGPIEKLCGDEILFQDKSILKADTIILATGYQPSFPFFKKNLVNFKDNGRSLYKSIMDPKIDNLFFIGHVSVRGSLFPIAEIQSRLVAKYLFGQYHLPSILTMKIDIKKGQEKYPGQAKINKHLTPIDDMEYSYDLQLECKEGMIRAQKKNYEWPVKARADSQTINQKRQGADSSTLNERAVDSLKKAPSSSERSIEMDQTTR